MHVTPVLSQAFPARIKAVESLVQAIPTRGGHPDDLRRAADELDKTGLLYGRASTGAAYSAFAQLVRIAALLVEWRAGVLGAVPDADRFLRAAKENYRLWVQEYADSSSIGGLKRAGAHIDNVTTFEDVGPVCQALAITPLPLGVFAHEFAGLRIPTTDFDDDETREEPQELAIAFLRFVIDGVPAVETHFLTPGEMHDLELEVRVSRWPDSATELQLSPVSIEPKSTYDFPVFRFYRPRGEPPYTMQQRGRAILNSPQSLNARPFEFRYTASFAPQAAEQPVAVVGQRTLRIEGFDLVRAPVTGYRGIDQKLVEIRNTLRRQSLITAKDLESLLIVLTSLGKLAGRALQDALFDDACGEAQFQVAIRDELRRDPLIAAELEEHPHAGGGITDLSFRGLRIELKFEASNNLSLQDCQRFSGQTASYVVATGKRVGVLCVLDNSAKRSAPYPAEGGIGVLPVHSGENQINVVAVLLQGNLARPSDLSRRSRAG
ncbi:MAG: hypothetical protein IT427_10935 [Pirellulales bacterium]|jgi:hypothetical protein|nr:hypothetical protein [Pirellulales bacterium]